MILSGIGPRDDYSNAQITIRKGGRKGSTGSRSYPLEYEVIGQHYFDPVRLRINEANLLELLDDPDEYGRALGKALFGSKCAGPYYAETLAAVTGRGTGVRVRLVIEPPELHELMWERLYQRLAGEWLPVGSTAVTPFSRFIRPQQWDRPSPVTIRPLKLLLVMASPSDIENYQLDSITSDEFTRLRAALEKLEDVQVTTLESGTALRPTRDEILRHLQNGYHFVHFLCHGSKGEEGSVLYLEGANGKTELIDQKRLVEDFKVLGQPPIFCFFSACESALRSRHDAFLPIGPALVEDGGVQAVVAMTDIVGLELAQNFAIQFYVRLLKHGLVDLAVNEARALVKDDWDWGVPVLYSRLNDNRLVDFPINEKYDHYLDQAGQAVTTVDRVIDEARLDQHGQALIEGLEALKQELGFSNKTLVEWAKCFRETGWEPETFKGKFETFYTEFKAYFESQLWEDEQTSCHQIEILGAEIMPKLRPLISSGDYDQLKTVLKSLEHQDGQLLGFFNDHLNKMNEAIDRIWYHVRKGEIEEAIEQKSEYEAQISTSFNKGKALFQRMTEDIHTARRA